MQELFALAAKAKLAYPTFDDLARQAAQETVVCNDGKAIRILDLTQEVR
ncbi:MAG TPA: hypothetical protein PK440_18420 [Candidatus Accumulibacter phosphatis]|nr:hypothetical protein [Candidatus Accumulibacter phosphatis]HRQ96947.1 hypothetical protein [Candidatus Accumulibacter phosphatis]